jgi:hypothetical protein
MIEHRLNSVNSSIHNIRSDIVVDRGTTKHHSDQSQTPTMNQMIAELHRCLILGEHPTSTLSSGFKHATTTARAHIVSHVCSHPVNDSLLTLNYLTACNFSWPTREIPARFEDCP